MRVKIIINIRLCSSISLCKFNSISSSQYRFISILEKMNSRLKLIVRRIPRETYRTKYFKPRDLSMEFLNGTDPIDSRFQTWSQVKSPCPCFRFAKKDVTRWFYSRPRPQERFPLNEMAIRDRKKKGNYFHGESEIDCYDYNRIITDPNWITRSFIRKEELCCFCQGRGIVIPVRVRFRNVDLDLEKNIDSRDNRYDFSSFSKNDGRTKKQRKCFIER